MIINIGSEFSCVEDPLTLEGYDLTCFHYDTDFQVGETLPCAPT